MRVFFYGAAQTVTGSQYLLEVNGQRLLLECGFYQGRRTESYARNLNFAFPPSTIDAAILSHAHIDHSGNLPNLVKRGYSNTIYTTPATADLADVMLQDSGHIQEADIEFVNKKRAKQHKAPLEPIYTAEDAKEVQKYFKDVRYGESFNPIKGVTAHLVDAGHILGSASVVLDIEENGRKFRFWFSGDIGRPNLPLIHDPTLPEDVDYLMMECTYGDKPHREPEMAFKEFRDVVLKTIRRGGKVIIPAFAVGRTQELVYLLNQLRAQNELPPVPVYVDSPLAVNATDIFRKHPECFDAETQEFVRSGHHPALEFPQLTYIRSVDESKALNDRHEPMIIISASGMAETGRILHHLRNNISDPKNTILIVSWQSPETLGRRLADKETRVTIFGEPYIRRAEVSTIGGLSAHAGQDMLVKYALASRRSLKKLVLVHGEPDAEGALVEKLHENGLRAIEYPTPASSLTFE